MKNIKIEEVKDNEKNQVFLIFSHHDDSSEVFAEDFNC